MEHACVLQYVVETRYTGEEHEVPVASQHVVGHHERVISAQPVNTLP